MNTKEPKLDDASAEVNQSPLLKYNVPTKVLGIAPGVVGLHGEALSVDRYLFTKAWLSHTVAGGCGSLSFAQTFELYVLKEMESSDWDTMTAVEGPACAFETATEKTLLLYSSGTANQPADEVRFAGAWMEEKLIINDNEMELSAEQHSSSAERCC